MNVWKRGVHRRGQASTRLPPKNRGAFEQKYSLWPHIVRRRVHIAYSTNAAYPIFSGGRGAHFLAQFARQIIDTAVIHGESPFQNLADEFFPGQDLSSF